ncbi:MAG: BBE domain-containing protein [Albidovulum sp.]|uniref:BBE domain-containing protein n=1 Tax=Albidovulum sp. TaxID=1872424 RepID=UPI003CACAB2B
MAVVVRSADESQDAACKAWARALFDKAAPLAEGSVYINFVPEAGEERSKGAFGANQARLERIKAKVDPANLFRANVMIQPKP